ncbi:hypothetical protein LZ30DRAFT_742896 [Colletotrichum cereale]|nr:hypothetical protein LZ30DRAFT_742896 [Colletotrichum cereale]
MLLAPEETALLKLDDQLRRSACDRCRCQKLRCERSNAGAGPGSNATTTDSGASARSPTGGSLPPCRRCQRVGAVCNTSFQQRPGRPRLSDDSSSRGARRARARQAAAHAPVDTLCHSQEQYLQQSSAAAAVSPRRPETSCTVREESFLAGQAPQAKLPLPVERHQSYVSMNFDKPGSSSPCGCAAHAERGGSTTAGEDHSGLWDSCFEDMIPSWEWDEQNVPGLVSADKGTASWSSTGVAAIVDETTAATVNQTPPADVGIQPTRGDHWKDLCRQVTDLSHALGRDVQSSWPSPPSSTSRANLGLGYEGNSCIQRAFQFCETLKSLTDELRIKTRQSPEVPSHVEVLPTPNSDLSSSSVSFTSKSICQLGGSCRASHNPTTMTTTAEVRPTADYHLDKIMSLHILTSYVCLNQGLKRTLGSILAAVISQQKGGGFGLEASSAGNLLPRWPHIQV